MKRRPGITLIEVLVAIFIMAIGLLALLTLFPLGALRMSQALQDDRAAASASAAANICDAFGIRTDPEYDPPAPASSLFIAPPSGFPAASQSGGGIPVYVDPFGTGALGGPSSYQTTPTPQTPGINRVSPSVIPTITEPNGTASMGARYFTLLDDATFLTNGQPDTVTSPVIPRGDRYTWAYLLHRSPPASKTGGVDLQIVVYAGRSTAVPSGEATYAASGAYQGTQVVLTYSGNTPPSIRRGAWILDTSYDDGTNGRPNTNSVHGDFYRVVTVTPSPTNANQMILELQDPISKPSGISAVTVMDNVADVFKRGTGTSNQWEFRNEKQ